MYVHFVHHNGQPTHLPDRKRIREYLGIDSMPQDRAATGQEGPPRKNSSCGLANTKKEVTTGGKPEDSASSRAACVLGTKSASSFRPP